MKNKIIDWIKVVSIVGLVIVVTSIAASITTFTLIEQYNHNYVNCTTRDNYYRVKVTINGKSSDYYIKELYEDSKTYKIVDENDVYHIVYKEDCEFYGKE